MNRSQHKLETRVCPGCGKEKTYPARNGCCSSECALGKRQAETDDGDNLAGPILEILKKRKRAGLTVEDIADALDRGPRVIAASLERLRSKGYNVVSRIGKRAAAATSATQYGFRVRSTRPLGLWS